MSEKEKIDKELKVDSNELSEAENTEKESLDNKESSFEKDLVSEDNIKAEPEDKISEEDRLLGEMEKLRDEKLRLLADMENLRKRTDKDRLDSIKYGSFNLARDILSPDDNLTRALDAIPVEEKNSPTINNLIAGLQMVQKEFLNILEKHGVKKINSLNEKFDHNYHQAMVEVEDDVAKPGTVVKEMQSGYTMHDRLLRPSMVGVSKNSVKSDKDKEKN